MCKCDTRVSEQINTYHPKENELASVPVCNDVLSDLSYSIELLHKELSSLAERLSPFMISPQSTGKEIVEECKGKEYASYFNNLRMKTSEIDEMRNLVCDMKYRLQI